MIPALLVGTAMLLVSVVTNGVASALIVRFVARLIRCGYAGNAFWKNVVVMMVATLIAMAGHLVQVALWAAAFLACGEFSSFEVAFYHSTGNYTTLGYGDIVMTQKWRLLGPLEAMNGVLQFGISTALMFAVMSRLVEQRLKHLAGTHAPAEQRD